MILTLAIVGQQSQNFSRTSRATPATDRPVRGLLRRLLLLLRRRLHLVRDRARTIALPLSAHPGRRGGGDGGGGGGKEDAGLWCLAANERLDPIIPDGVAVE